MWPPAHPAVAYLVYAGWTRLAGRPIEPATVGALVIGGTLPDLIDQPLAALGLIPTTRALGHSVLVAAPIVAVVVAVARRRGRPRVGTAFGIGYGSHVAADALWPAIFGPHRELGFLLWPVTPSLPYEPVKHVGSVAGVELTTFAVEIVLLVAGIGLWLAHGAPGVRSVAKLLRRGE